MIKNGFRYGAVYRVERHDSRKNMVQKLSDMKACGMDTVVIWPSAFWWEEKTPRYPFDTGLFLLDEAEKLGIHVIMELAGQIPCMEYAPDFDFQEDFYCINEDGTIRKQACWYDPVNYNHPVLKEKIRSLYQKIALAYGKHSALYRYDIWNEAVFKSYDPWTRKLFQSYLKQKYGTIEKLNDNWERTYQDFDQIDFTSWMWSSIKPQTDYSEFSKWNVGQILEEWRGYIRQVDTVHPVVADNIGCMVNADWAFDRPQDDRQVSRHTDEYGISFYPKQCDADEHRHADRHITLSSARAAADGDFWISEMQGHIQALFRPSTAVKPYEIKRWCLEAIGHGAKGIVYWKWDPFFKGLQSYGRGLVDFEGNPTPRLQMASNVRKEIEKYEKQILASKSMPARVGVLFDGENHNFVKALCKNYNTPPIYTDKVCAAYQAFFESGVQTDIVYPESEWSHLKLLVICNQVVMRKELGEKLEEFVRQGGTVLFSGMTCLMDESSVIFKHIPGGAFQNLFGCQQIDTEYGADYTISFLNTQIHCGEYRNILKLRSELQSNSQVMAQYADGLPGVIYTACGKGGVLLFAGEAFAQLDSAKELAAKLRDQYALSLTTVKGNVTVHVSQWDEGFLVFIFNYTGEEQTYSVLLENNKECTGKIQPYDSIIREIPFT